MGAQWRDPIQSLTSGHLADREPGDHTPVSGFTFVCPRKITEPTPGGSVTLGRGKDPGLHLGQN